MITLRTEYDYAIVFENPDQISLIQLAEWDVTLSDGAIAVINQYGEVFWADGVERNYQQLANRISGKVRLWNGLCYVTRKVAVPSIMGGQHLSDEYIYPEAVAS